jgi:hypothetical protein
VEVCPEAINLFFCLDEKSTVSLPLSAMGLPEAAVVVLDSTVLQVVDVLRRQNADLRLRLQSAENRLEETTRDYEALQSTSLARAAMTAEKCPTLVEALELFTTPIETSVVRRHAKDVISVVRRFTDSLPPKTSRPIDVSANQVESWLNKESAQASKPLARRDGLRR